MNFFLFALRLEMKYDAGQEYNLVWTNLSRSQKVFHITSLSEKHLKR